MMEFTKAHKLFINALATESLQNVKHQLKQMKALNEELARECCLKTLCSLSEESGEYSPFIKEIIESTLFESPHHHFLLSVASTLVYNCAKKCRTTEQVYYIVKCLASRSNQDKKDVLDSLDDDGYSSLHLSVANGDWNATKLLLKLGSDCNKKSQSGNTALSLSIAYRHHHLLPLFLHQSNVNTQDFDHDTPLMFAAWNKQPKIVSTLIQCGADVNAVSKYGTTALWNAVYCSSPESVLVLLSHNSRMDVECEGTHLFFDENDCNEEKVRKIYPGHKRSVLWVGIDRIGIYEQSLKVLLIIIEAGYDVTKERWLKTSEGPETLYTNSALQYMLHFLQSKPQSLKDLCRNRLRKCHKLSSLSFHEWVEKIGLPSTLKEYLTLSYILP